jgi:sugar phosphate isomerase/epimerase
MSMTSGLMVTRPLEQWDGKALGLSDYLKLVKGWGTETLDIFEPFFEVCPPAELRTALSDHGLRCACCYAAADLVAIGAEAEARGDDAIKLGIENAAAVGAPLLFTYGSQHGHAGEENFQRYIGRLGDLLPLFQGTGITFVVENAGALMHRPQDMHRMMEVLALGGLRLCQDTGNFYLWEQDEVAAVALLADWTVHFHVKDYVDRHRKAPLSPGATDVNLGEGAVRHSPVLEALRQAGYEGVLALEPHTAQAIAPGLQTLNRWIAGT